MSTPVEENTWRHIALIAIGLLVCICLSQTFFFLKKSVFVSSDDDEAVEDFYYVERLSFASLPHWESFDHFSTVKPFLLSCEKIKKKSSTDRINPRESFSNDLDVPFSGYVSDWIGVCEEAEKINTPIEAKAFFETAFTPVTLRSKAVKSAGKFDEGLFTGYYEPVYAASKTRTEEFSTPILGRPKDLIMVDLGAFREELSGTRIAGTVKNGRLIPFKTHEEIIEEGLETDIFGWINPNDLLFLQIQGSGKLQIGDELIRLGYAAQNGHAYTAIGRPLIEQGEIPREEMSMQAIDNWLENATNERAKEIRYMNESYVFFRPLNNLRNPELGPIGAGNTQLTAMKSLAVDRRFYPMGMPVLVSYEATEGGELQHYFLVAQDTGGAIKGAIRGDVFIGSGDAAGAIAGEMAQKGSLIALLPNSVVERLN